MFARVLRGKCGIYIFILFLCFIPYYYTFIFMLKNIYVCHANKNSYIKFRGIGIFKVLNSLFHHRRKCYKGGSDLFSWIEVDIWWAFRILLLNTLKTMLHFYSYGHNKDHWLLLAWAAELASKTANHTLIESKSSNYIVMYLFNLANFSEDCLMIW